MREKLIALIEEQADFRPVSEGTTFEEIGMDSLDFILMIQDVRTKIGPITDLQAQKIVTVRRFAGGALLSYQLERWAEFVKDGKKLFPEHYKELARDQDKIPLDINEELYVDADARGVGHIVTVRDEGALVGYAILAVMPHLHYKSAGPMAMIDVYYLKSEYRKGGTGAKMIMFAEATLRKRGVRKIYFSTKVHRDNGRLLEALGFTFSDKVYTKLLE